MTFGIDHKNPLNIRLIVPRDPWQGRMPEMPGDQFVRFSTMAYGIRAAAKVHKSYRNSGRDTVEEIVESWAPPGDHNDTEGYIAVVCSIMSDILNRMIERHARIDVRDWWVERALIRAQSLEEVGCIPFTEDDLASGLTMAGLIKPT